MLPSAALGRGRSGFVRLVPAGVGARAAPDGRARLERDGYVSEEGLGEAAAAATAACAAGNEVIGFAAGGGVVRLTDVVRPAVPAELDFGRDAEVGLVEVFRRDLKCGELGDGGRRAQSAGLDVFDLVIGDKVLCYATDGERERLRWRERGT